MPKKENILMEGTNNLGIIICHTLGADPQQMKPLGKKLNKLGYTVSIPLYDGHGGSFTEVIQSEVPLWYDNVVEAYSELSTKVEKIFVIGMSIGGTFSVKLAEEYDLAGIITVNAPIIGFDLYTDLWQFMQNNEDKEMIKRYRDHRRTYFRFVTELGQIEALKQITAPLFVLQGSLDATRYKTSSMMLMEYVSSEVKQRKDYPRSRHLLLLEADKKEATADIIEFIQEQSKQYLLEE
ncbi:alpha/beta hydrolase [Candidatus Xianfuyuplasma coldseepsis]|uniref:AB hydrolase-1 domain-containing protein n=1 Tax=Candidatus Xianfuyuplasma coldseepsis TaxID=2782163 RepID=A0A7L7KT39_9MOLU|nr:alpha/beta fold hydrolase [Xianfuyuplasma coldseepsis]QMS85775.1 hypothetical protein G4Z02_08465 [Xianfuyuplasma coldseepsis]